jgi:hypothetical protein
MGRQILEKGEEIFSNLSRFLWHLESSVHRLQRRIPACRRPWPRLDSETSSNQRDIAGTASKRVMSIVAS